VLACGDDRETCRRSQYSGTAGLRLCRRLPGVALVAAIVSALAVSGCSYRLASLVSKDDTDFTPTGSVTQPADRAVPLAIRSGPAEADLAYARAAASNVLAGGGKDASVPWQNPQTGASGNITPFDSSYSEDGHPCRDFLTSYVHGAVQDWLQGAACRTSSGAWEVMRLTPLKPS
jgi:17 kDa outer membrane surface antigen